MQSYRFDTEKLSLLRHPDSFWQHTISVYQPPLHERREVKIEGRRTLELADVVTRKRLQYLACTAGTHYDCRCPHSQWPNHLRKWKDAVCAQCRCVSAHLHADPLIKKCARTRPESGTISGVPRFFSHHCVQLVGFFRCCVVAVVPIL